MTRLFPNDYLGYAAQFTDCEADLANWRAFIGARSSLLVGTGFSMSPGDQDAGTSQSAAAQFNTTHWSVVLAAGQSSSPAAQAALEQLCRAYWYPLYCYVRRAGHSPEDAQDLTQDFFARLLEKNYFALASRERGRFRSFLLTSL